MKHDRFAYYVYVCLAEKKITALGLLLNLRMPLSMRKPQSRSVINIHRKPTNLQLKTFIYFIIIIYHMAL